MEAGPSSRRHTNRSEGRPYRSHSHPACLACRKRKSRCKTRDTAESCIMCQAHGTSCVFPPAQEARQRRSARSTKSSAKTVVEERRTDLNVAPPASCTGASCQSGRPHVPPFYDNNYRGQDPSKLVGIAAEAGDDSSHVVSPAIADDSDVLQSYLATTTEPNGRPAVPSFPTVTSSARASRRVLFRSVPRRLPGVTSHHSRAAEKCELIEKLIEPHAAELLDLFFQKSNICFPMFDEISFKSAYSTHREKISPALLSNLYACALIYWQDSPKLRANRCPDVYFIWAQAYEALSSEGFLSPGTSTVISIVLNVSGRPTTSMFANGGLMGHAVALSNGLGLNRNPSSWNISLLEKQIRIKIWWLVVIHDRWCSLAYGTPPQTHRAQHDVPIPTAENLCAVDASRDRMATASVFSSLITLTEVLGCYLEYVYHIGDHQVPPEMSSVNLELLLGEWEQGLSESIRRAVLRGTGPGINTPGGANLRLAYLAVKLLLRRIQLDLDKGTHHTEEGLTPYLRAQRAAEDIVHFVQELDESHCRGFWIPTNAYTLTSATSFLLRCSLRSGSLAQNTPLNIAKDMISTLRSHRQNFSWDLADNCLGNCGGMIEMIEAGINQSSPILPNSDEYPDIDVSVLDDLLTGFGDPFEMDL